MKFICVFCADDKGTLTTYVEAKNAMEAFNKFLDTETGKRGLDLSPKEIDMLIGTGELLGGDVTVSFGTVGYDKFYGGVFDWLFPEGALSKEEVAVAFNGNAGNLMVISIVALIRALVKQLDSIPSHEGYWTGSAMVEKGGSFINALGIVLQKADPDNMKAIRAAFSEYWCKYEPMGKEMKGE